MSNTSQNPHFNWELPLVTSVAWDLIVLASVPSPGVIKSIDFDRKNKWDKKIGKGTIGAVPTYVGKPPAEGKITFVLWTAAQRLAWTSFVQMLQPTTVGAAASSLAALDIYHPSLADIGVSKILVPADKIGNLRHVGKGRYEVEIELTEFIPPPASGMVVATPKTSKSDVDADQAAQTAYQQRLAAAAQYASKGVARIAQGLLGNAAKP